MISAADFIEQLVVEFPELRDEVEDPIVKGLLHMQVHVLERATNSAIEAGDISTAGRHFEFVDRFFGDAEPDLENALNVSYLEHLRFESSNERLAWEHLSPKLRQGWKDMMAYLEALRPKPSQKTEKVKHKKQSRGSKAHRRRH